MGGHDLGVFSRGKLTGTLPPSRCSPPCLASGSPSQGVKLWIRVQSDRGGYGRSGHLPHRTVSHLCLSVWWGGKKGWRWQWEQQTGSSGGVSCGAPLQPPSCLEVDGSISISFACIGGTDTDQPEYQRCEAGMTSPRVCLLPEPCQATLPACSQHPPPTRLDNKLQPATAGASQRAGWVPARLRQGIRYFFGISVYQTLRAPWWSQTFSWALGSGTLWR